LYLWKYDAYYLEAAYRLKVPLITFDELMKEEVIISRKDGCKFRLLSMRKNRRKGKSPLEDIKGIITNVTMDDILDAIRESRER